MSDMVSYAEHEALMLDYQAADKDRRSLRRKLAALERDQAVTEDSPEATNVIALLDLWWKEVKDSDPRVAHGLESTRAPKVKAALRRRKKVDGGEDEAFDMCRRAILGVRYDQWAMGLIHKSQGKSFNDIAEHILNTDGDIEKFAKLYDDHHQPVELSEARDRKALERGVQACDDREAKLAETGRESRERVLSFGDQLTPWDRMIGALQARGCAVEFYPGQPDSFKAQCPAHDDTNPSLGVKRAVDGRLLLFCRTGCATADVLSALGLAFSDLFEGAERDHGSLTPPIRVQEGGRWVYEWQRQRQLPVHLRRALRDLLGEQEAA